jgi:glycine C-acetyltransferase
VTGSPTMPGPARLPQLWQPLVRDAAKRRDFTRTDPLDRSALAAAAGPPFAPAEKAAVAHRLAGLLGWPAVMTFASGDEAIRRTLSALLAEGDDVIVDAGSERAMFETVLQLRARVHRAPPGSVEAVERRLSRLSRSSRTGRIFVLVPAVSRLSSVVADLDDLCGLCAHYGATLVVDTSQDLGCMGHAGLGVAETQGCLSRIDLCLGDLSATFGVAGGFAAFRDPMLRNHLVRHGPASPLSPDAAAIILTVLDLIASPEGRRRRRRVLGASLRLRNHLLADGLAVMGQPSPVVPLRLPSGTARALTALAASAGLSLPLVEAPEVASRAPRWLIRLNASHGPADIDDLAGILHDLIRCGERRTLGTTFRPGP